MSDSGLFSSLRGFVARELDSFVLAATGQEAVASSSRTDQPKRVSKPAPKKRKSNIPKNEPKTRPKHVQHRAVHTMPGSLYPRSASMVPETSAPIRYAPRQPSLASTEEFSNSEVFPNYLLKSEKAKGKQRAREETPNEFMQGSLGSLADEFARADTTVEIRSNVWGMERELEEAREEHARNERHWREQSAARVREQSVRRDRQESVAAPEALASDDAQIAEEIDRHQRAQDDSARRDKERIQSLEQEITRLKAELSQRPSSRAHPPPPPPPPPPPTWGSAPASIFRPDPNAPNGGAVFASARAALKHAPVPVEAPINNLYAGARTKRTGQPVINVSSDKMAAFLQEVKTCRLRKVGSIGNLSRSTSGTDSSFDQSIDLGSRSMDDSRIGAKRKRGDDVHDILHSAVRRRASDAGALQRTNSFASTSSGKTYYSYADTQYPRKASDVPPPSSVASSSQSRSGPPVSNNSTDLTTPSLSSDNEEEQDNEELSSPPALPLHDDQLVDVQDDENEEPPTKKYPASPHVKRISGVLSSRIPASPMPQPSPQRPRPPARTGIPIRRAAPAAVVEPETSDEENTEEHAASPPGARTLSQTSVSRIPVRHANARRVPLGPGESSFSGKPRVRAAPIDPRRSRAASRHEYELETGDVTHQAWHYGSHDQEGQEEEEDGEKIDLENGVFSGVGTASKTRGFLARGGAGGEPVFMSVGYVEGVDEP